MTPLCTLVVATLLAAQPPLPLSPPADRTPGAPPAKVPAPKQQRPLADKEVEPGAPPAKVPVPKPPAFRAAGADATVGEMRLEQKQVARLVIEMAMFKLQGGHFTDADLRTTIADIQRCADIEKSLAQLDGERVEAVLTQLLSLTELESYFQARAAMGIGGADTYLDVRFHRLGARASLLEEVKADPAVIRRHREGQVAAGKSRDEEFAKRRAGGQFTANEAFFGPERTNSEASSAASHAATPAERDAVNRKAVESLKENEKYFTQRIASGIARESTLHLVTYLRLDAELREVSAAENPPADRVRQLREQRRDAIRRAVELEAGRRDKGLFGQGDTDQLRTAQRYLIKAELALAADAEARRVLLARNLEEAVSYEKRCEGEAKGGIASESRQYRSTRERIEAEIRLKLAK